MSANRELADFLRRARGARDPAESGLPVDGRVRRVPGLRREEVAFLAGVSNDYYTRLEQGRPITPSPGVVEAVAVALDLDEAGRTHLEHLIGPPGLPGRRRAPSAQRVRPAIHQLLDSLDGHPAFVLGRRTEVLAANGLARALLVGLDSPAPGAPSYVRWMFLSAAAKTLFVDWKTQARAAVESLRLDLGDHPNDAAADDLVAELTDRSPDFGRWWEEHRVHQRTHGTKRLRHPVAGELTIAYETFALPGDPDQSLFVYSTEAGTASRQAMDLLASWRLPTGTGEAPVPHET